MEEHWFNSCFGILGRYTTEKEVYMQSNEYITGCSVYPEIILEIMSRKPWFKAHVVRQPMVVLVVNDVCAY